MARKAAKTSDKTIDDKASTLEAIPLAPNERYVRDVFADTGERKFLSAPDGARIVMARDNAESTIGTIPAVDSAYTWTKDNVKFAQTITSGLVSRHWLIDGPPGCGKTEFAYQLAARSNRAITVLECHEGIEADSLFSTLEPNDEAKSGFARVDGPIVHAMRDGDLLLLDELKGLRPAVQMALYNMLDGRPVMIRQTGHRIAPHPDFRVIATVNDVADEKRASFKGAFPLTDPLKSRFAALRFAPLGSDEEQAAILKRVPGLAPKVAGHLVAVANVVRAEAVNGLLRELSFRELVVAARFVVAQRGAYEPTAEQATQTLIQEAQSLSIEQALSIAYSAKEAKPVGIRLEQIIKDHKSLMKA